MNRKQSRPIKQNSVALVVFYVKFIPVGHNQRGHVYQEYRFRRSWEIFAHSLGTQVGHVHSDAALYALG